MMKTTGRHDYPNKPIGGGNPYYMCAHCGISDPQINGRLRGHGSWCEWRLEQIRLYLGHRKNRDAIRAQAKLSYNQALEDVAMALGKPKMRVSFDYPSFVRGFKK